MKNNIHTYSSYKSNNIYFQFYYMTANGRRLFELTSTFQHQRMGSKHCNDRSTHEIRSNRATLCEQLLQS